MAEEAVEAKEVYEEEEKGKAFALAVAVVVFIDEEEGHVA